MSNIKHSTAEIMQNSAYKDSIVLVDNNKETAMFLREKALQYSLINKPAEAIEYIQRAIEINHEAGDSLNLGIDYNYKGKIFERQELFRESAVFYSKSYKLLKDLSDSIAWESLKLHIVVSNKGGISANNNSLFYMAEDHLKYSYNKRKHAELMNVKAVIHVKTGQFKQAIKLLDSAIIINRELNNKTKLSINYTNKGGAYYNMKNIDSAQKYLQLGYNTAYKEKTAEQIVRNAINLAAIMQLKRRYDKALNIYNEILSTRHNEMGFETRASLFFNISSVYSRKGDWNMATQYLDSASVNAKRCFNYKLLVTIYNYKASIEARSKDFNKAYVFRSISSNYKDSLKHVELSNAMTNAEWSRKLIEHERKLENQRSDKLKKYKSANKILYWISIPAILFLIILLIYVAIIRKKYTKTKNISINYENRLNQYKTDLQDTTEKYEATSSLNNSLTNDLSRTLFLIQECRSILSEFLKRIKKESHFSSIVTDIETKIRGFNDLANESDLINDNYNNRTIDLKNKITQRYQNLSKSDLKLCLLLKLQYSVKEIAVYNNTTTKSVEVSRYRLRKKLGYEDLNTFISDLNKI
ncbi:MAG: hypothetical protein N4A72_20900 [Bacteroidales bacterium]|jgi:tetratricopeptide (TPR) repeat protein|nr:hypothetical protein [Bacteroidales bacterium]